MEMLLNALINGESIDFEPQSRMEAYLKNCINKTGTEGLPPPESRADALLYKLAESIKASYIDISDSTATAEDIRLGKTAYIADGKVIGTAERSLKKLLDAKKRAYYLFDNFKNDSTDGFIEYADTSNVTNMSSMFNGCSSLTTVSAFDTSNVTNMSSMFNRCSSLTTVPSFDTSNVTNMDEMFNECSSLTTVPAFDTSNVIGMRYMFNECLSLTTVPAFNTSNVTNMSSMFRRCSSLTTVSAFDTSNVTNMSSMFYGCSSLTTVPELDMFKVSSAPTMFGNCASLTNCFLRNIKCNLTIGSETTYGHLLTLESLLFMIKELIDTGSKKTFTVGTANLKKLANIYVKTVEITDEMRTEDPNIDLKLPFETCESTDEGAKLITEYVGDKHWALA